MRNLLKVDEPEVLSDNHESWLEEYEADAASSSKKYKYRHPDIKQSLKEETGYKCIYCESKIGHNTPGDIEHKIPSSKRPDLHFTWTNLTIACTECNRRKNDYYVVGDEFLDPYTEDVENQLEHHGPLVLWKTNNTRAEISVKILELHSIKRKELISRKIGRIEEFNNLVERYTSEANDVLKGILGKQIEEQLDKHSEYSAMLASVLTNKGITIGSS